MDKIKQRIGELNKELLSLRRDFHKHPELGFEEHRTAGVVENYLKNLGLDPQRMTKTGVVALMEGSNPHPVLMLRADMDALPVEEENDVAYKSKNKGIMHACGHDAHMAMLLVAAKILSENKVKIPGTIKFVFQKIPPSMPLWESIYGPRWRQAKLPLRPDPSWQVWMFSRSPFMAKAATPVCRRMRWIRS
jgi:amidohydrolase